jgi:hypothetical protein
LPGERGKALAMQNLKLPFGGQEYAFLGAELFQTVGSRPVFELSLQPTDVRSERLIEVLVAAHAGVAASINPTHWASARRYQRLDIRCSDETVALGGSKVL